MRLGKVQLRILLATWNRHKNWVGGWGWTYNELCYSSPCKKRDIDRLINKNLLRKREHKGGQSFIFMTKEGASIMREYTKVIDVLDHISKIKKILEI